MIRPLAAALFLSLPTASQAQSTADIVAGNIQRAITMCIRQGPDLATLRQAFANSGHTHSIEDLGGGNVIHYYATPSRDVSTAVLVSQGTLNCRISTDHFSVSQMIPFSRAVLDQLYDGPIWDASPEGAKITPGTAQAANASCTGFHILPGRTVIWFTFGVAGQDPVCIDNGTAQIMISL